jgi:ribosomal protein L20
MHALRTKHIEINRKLLAEFAMNQPELFRALVRRALS